MKTLDKHWLTSGLLDAEYKKYILLAYLQHVKEHFDQTRLYPFLSDLVFHYQNLKDIRENKQLIGSQFPKLMSGIDMENLRITYEKLMEDDELMQFLEEVIEYAMPLLKKQVEEGKDIYEYVEENTEISPVGVTPLFPDVGYMFVYQTVSRQACIYSYQITIFENASERYRGIHTQFVESFTTTLVHTFEHKKLELARRFQHLPNPAAYLISCRLKCPVDETLLPIAKRMLVRYVS
jgi:hypothetical protein